MPSPSPTPQAFAQADQAGRPLLIGSYCHTRIMLEQLPPNAHAALLQALTTDAVKTVDIARVLNAHGLPARAENVGRHRRRLTGGQNTCKCPRLSEATQ